MSESESPGISIFTQNFDFTDDQHGWQHGFAEYPAGPTDSTYYELKYGYVPEPTGTNSIMLSGNNRADALFMYIKRKLGGLSPNTEYILTFNVTFFPNPEEDLVASTQNVFVKAGATALEPKSVIDRDRFVMNIDKGVSSESGDDMIALGDITTPSGTYAQVTRTNSTYNNPPFKVRSNSRGEIWLIVGTDSGATGKTTLYYSKIFVTLSASN
ncbi:MAG TPA: hypothetical protein VGD40_15205 [Chryseosolibacter sp.]